MTKPSIPHTLQLLLAGSSALALSACLGLHPQRESYPAFYALRQTQAVEPPAVAPPHAAATLIVTPAHAAPGFDSPHIIYVRTPYQTEYFAQSEWIEPPAQMLGPLMVKAIEQTGAFRAVILTPGSATGELRLDTEVIRLQHDFQTQPSHVRFTLRAYLVDEKSRQILAWREFDARVTAHSEDALGGVVAANEAVGTVLAQLSQFCAETARTLRPTKSAPTSAPPTPSVASNKAASPILPE